MSNNLTKKEFRLVKSLAPILKEFLQNNNALLNLKNAYAGTLEWKNIATFLDHHFDSNKIATTERPRFVKAIIQQTNKLIREEKEVKELENYENIFDKKTDTASTATKTASLIKKNMEEKNKFELAKKSIEKSEMERQRTLEQGAIEAEKEYELTEAALAGEITEQEFYKKSQYYKKSEISKKRNAHESPSEFKLR
jgi:hypothetical protein